MAARTFAQEQALGWNQGLQDMADAFISGQNPDGTPFVLPVSATAAGNTTTVSASAVIAIATNVTARTTGSGASSAAAVGTGIFRSGAPVLTFSNVGIGAGASIVLIIQSSFDGGVTFADVAAFDSSTPADATTLQFSMFLSESSTSSVATKVGPGTLAARAMRGGGQFGSTVRVFEVVTGTYTTAPVYSIQGVFKS